MSKIKKAINFDLNTNALKMYYPGKHWRKAYKDVGNFLKENGFSHRQWSGYISKNSMGRADILKMVEELKNKFPWLNNCINRFDVTDIGKEFDMSYVFVKNDKIMDEKETFIHHKKTNTKPHSSLSQLKQVAKEQMNEINKNKTHEQNQNIIKNRNER